MYVLKARADYAVEGSVGFKFIIEGARYEPPDAAMIAAFKAAAGTSTEAGTSPDNVPKGAPAAPRPRRQTVLKTAGAPAGAPVDAAPAPKHWTEIGDDEYDEDLP